MASTTSTATSPSTTAPTTRSDLNISLEAHLIDHLRPLLPVLPLSLRDDLASVLPLSNAASSSEPKVMTPRLVSYALLSSVSAWTRSPSGKAALGGLSPPLHPNSYSMVSLLAGTRTSPERIFPAHDMTAVVGPERDSQRSRSDRRAITALLNALLSVIGSGVATWWAADRLHWKEEWRVLLALFVAMTVAIAEGVLYLIWDSRRSKVKISPPRTHKVIAARRKSSEATSAGPVSPPVDAADPTVGSSPQGQKQKVTIEGSDSITPFPTAHANVQTHAIVDGLRERGQRQR